MTQPLYLDVDGTAVFCLFDEPVGTSRNCAVLLAPPVGWPEIASYRARRDWSARLAASGHPVLRIDLPGTGDSAGHPRDPGRLAAWVSALAHAADALRDLGGRPRLAAIGVGLGGLVLLDAARNGASFDDLALWGVRARGGRHIREMQALARMESETEAPDTASDGDAGLQSGGFWYGAETLADLTALDVSAATDLGTVQRVLLLERDETTVDAAVRDALRDSGIAVACAPGPGYGAMFSADPQLARPALPVLDAIRTWIDEDGATAASPSVPRRRDPASYRDSVGVTLGDSGSVRETALFVPTSAGRAFGVLTEPVTGRAGLSAVLLNAGVQRRIGVNRMWVEVARRWSSRGVSCLRLDLEGIGDADGDAGLLVEDRSLYDARYVIQMREVLDGLVSRGLPDRFLLIGLCGGAYWSYATAVQDDRVSAAVLINPRALAWDDDAVSELAMPVSRRLRRGALDPMAWRRLLSSAAAQRHLLGAIAAAAGRRANPVARQRIRTGRDRMSEEIDAALDTLAARDQRLRFVFTAQEPLDEGLSRDGRFDESDRWPNVSRAGDPGLGGGTAANHTLRPLRLQRAVHAELDAFIAQETQRAYPTAR